MKRRDFIATAALAAGLPRLALAQHAAFNPRPGAWRTFEMTTRLEILAPEGATRAWVPLPSVEGDSQKAIGNAWTGNAAARVAHDGKYGAAMIHAEWAASEKAPVLEVVSRFTTRDRAVDLSRPGGVAPLSAAEVAFYTAPTALQPTDGIVRKTALEATRGAKGDLEKARRLYEWVVERTERNPKTRGCGVGDIAAMLESGDLTGKCADLNALYVGMARAVGLPARDLYGIRVAKSAFGYRSLGAGTENVTRAQHCRAEVFITGYGWIPVDPADVRKVVLEEKPKPVTLADPVVPPVREKLFGAWEMNWLAYNMAHDVKLPGSSGPAVGFFMYPCAETAKGRLDSLDPDNFRYRITVKELAA
jgi:transglutaminase-like putative cysteine protease